jgi:hypothetical protein
MLIYLLVGLLVCALFAYQIAEQKRAGSQGFWLGLFLGPAGVIAAGFMEGRPQCPKCGGRLNDTKDKEFNTCPDCCADLASIRATNACTKATSPVRLETKRRWLL